MEDKKTYCPTCYIGTFNPDWDKLNKEFDEMLKNVLKKNDTETKDKIVV